MLPFVFLLGGLFISEYVRPLWRRGVMARALHHYHCVFCVNLSSACPATPIIEGVDRGYLRQTRRRISIIERSRGNENHFSFLRRGTYIAGLYAAS